jgi:hypothetical protein
MTNTPAYSGYGVPAGGDGQDSLAANESKVDARRLRRSLWMVVAVLGVAIFAVSFGSPDVPAFPARLAVLAAIVAAVCLLPGQGRRGWIIVTLTLAGFLDALSAWIRAADPSWALTVILVLSALQSVAAIGALLHEARMLRPADSSDSHGYSPYLQMAEAYQAAYRAYAAHYQQTVPSQHYATGQGTAQAGVGATASAHTVDGGTAAAQESFAVLQARYERFNENPSPPQQPPGSTEGLSPVPVADTAPGVNRVVRQSQPYRAEPGSSAGASG